MGTEIVLLSVIFVVSWKNFALAGISESATNRNENETGQGVDRQAEESIDEESGVTKRITATEKGNYATKDGALSPDIPLFKKDDDKKLITLETMRKSERRQGDSGTEQLVTFKVTVRQAKEKTSSDGSVAVNAMEELEDGLDANDDGAGPSGKGHHSNGNDSVTNGGEIKETLDNVLSKRAHKNGKGALDSGKSMTGNKTRRMKRKSSDRQSKEKWRAKNDGGKGDILGNMQEKRKRTAFNNERKNILEQYFEKSIYASKTVVEEISKELGIDKKKIDNWFRNRRSKLKKDEEECSKRNVQLKTRKGGKKIEKEKGTADRSCGASLADKTVEEDKNETDGKNLDSESIGTNCNEKREKDGKDNLEEDDGKEGKYRESKQDENDLTREEKVYDEVKCKDKEALDETLYVRNDLNNGNRNEKVVKSEFCTEDKITCTTASEMGGNNMDFEKELLHCKNERECSNRIESNELKKDCDKDVLNELKKASENNNSEKYERGNTEEEWKEEKGLLEEETVRKVKDVVKDEISELKSVFERVASVAEVTDDRDDELSLGQKMRKPVIQGVNSATEEYSNGKLKLPRVSCAIKSEDSESRSETSVKNQIPLHVADTSSCRIYGESEHDRKMSLKCEGELEVQICDRGLNQRDSMIDKSWSSISHGSTFSLGVSDEYENENVETNARDDLAIALNSDPEFMKDFSELMNIAKTC